MEDLVQQFLGGGQPTSGPELHASVNQLLAQAPAEHGVGAIASALESLGAGGFGQSVAQGAAGATPQQRNGLADMLLHAVSQGGGSPNAALSQLGIGGQSLGPSELGMLAEHVAGNHGDALAGVLGNQIAGGSGGGGGMMQLLGNPMVRQIGMQLAKRLV